MSGGFENIDVREMIKSDGKFVLEIRNDDSTRLLLHNSDKYTLEQFNTWFEYESPYWFIATYENYNTEKNKLYQLPFGYFRTSNVDFKNKSIRVGMDIHPKFRGMGLARPSYRKFFDLLKSRKFETLDLEVLKKNKLAHSLYLKLGFVETGRVMRGSDLESIIMERKIL